MNREGGLLAWQWDTYERNHRDRLNLCVHFLAVPMFIAAVAASLVHLLRAEWLGAGVSLGVLVLAFLLQGFGHRREALAPVPFDGPADFLGRVFAEQFITFPRFVLSGGWMRNLVGSDGSTRGPHG
jgi:uncharacterized membrane protein YGL010W